MHFVERRRLLISIGGLAVAVCLAIPRVAAQTKTRPPRVALLLVGSARTEPETVEQFRAGLRDSGHIDGQNVILDIREIDGMFDRLPKLMEAILLAKPDVIVLSGSLPMKVARSATSTIPIVAISVGDPVEQGIAKSLSSPGGNVTGNALIQEVSDQKTVEIVRELVPTASRIALLVNPTNPITERTQNRFQSSAAKLGFTTVFVAASNADELRSALVKLQALNVGALIVANDGFFRVNRKAIIEFVAQIRLPGVFTNDAFAADGGLLTYTYDRNRLVRNAAAFVDRILKGRKPAELPFEQPTHFQLVINLKTAQAAGITIPRSLLLRADQVIQ